MKVSPTQVAGFIISASLLLLATPSKAVTTYMSATADGSGAIFESYSITLDSSQSYLRQVDIFCYNSANNVNLDYRVVGNLALQGPGTSIWQTRFTMLPAGPNYSNRGTCAGNNNQGKWYAGSTEVIVTVQ